MRYCRNCGAPLDDDALFCRECGTKIEGQPVPQSSPVIPEIPPVVVPTAMPQPQLTETETHSETDTFVDVERDNTLYYIIGGVVAAVLLAVGGWWFYSHHNGNNNPLGVEKPKWEQFVKVNAVDVMLFKEADTNSPNLKLAVERLDGCMPGEKMLWEGEKVPRGYDANNYPVENNAVFPVLDESDEWYRVYIGTGEIREAYLQKKYCEEVKPEPITKDIIDKVISHDYQTHKLVEKGEFANLYLERYMDEMGDGETVSVGVLTDGCIVMPNVCHFYPVKKDSTETDMRNTSESLEYNIWQFDAPEKYWKPASENIEEMFDVNLLEDGDIQKIVMAVRPSGNTDTKVCYYFPTVATDRFVEFEYSFSPAVASEVEEDKAVAKYEIQNNKLMAEINGEMIDTGIDGEFGIDLMLTSDLDDDGSMECVIQVGTGGNIVESPFVLTYDLDEEKFVKAGDLEFADTPTIEEKDGKTLLLQRAGLRWIRYGMEDHKLKRVEDEVKMVGSVRNTIEMDNIYGEDEEGEVKVKQDFDGDGNDDEFTFSRGMSHAAGYGAWMGMNTVVLSDGTSYDLGLAAAKFKILNETTNGMPDIIGDDYLYRWNGSSYDSYGWDGTNLVKTY